jgi:hypothetical protein
VIGTAFLKHIFRITFSHNLGNVGTHTVACSHIFRAQQWEDMELLLSMGQYRRVLWFPGGLSQRIQA